MLKDREKLYQLYHVLLCAALTWAFALVLNQYYTLRIPFFVTAALSLIVSLLLYIFDLTKKKVISYIIISCTILLLTLILWLEKFNPVNWSRDFINWCMDYNGSKELYSLRYAIFAIFIAVLAGSVLLYLLMKSQLAKIITAAVLLIALIVLCVSRVEVGKTVVGISIFYIMTIVIELYGMIYSTREGKKNKKEGMLYLAPVCLLLCILAMSLPSHKNPIQWTIIKMAYSNIKNQIEIWQADFDYYFGKGDLELFMTYSGYSDKNGNLDNGGLLLKDNNEALKVSGLEYNDSVYLAGSIADTYTGYSWQKSKKDYLADEKDFFLDYMELFLALSRQNPKVLNDSQLVKSKDIVVYYNRIKTKTLFYPLKTSNIDIFSSYKKISADTPQITFNRARGKGTSYQSTFYEMNLKDEAFQKILRETDSFSYDKTPSINRGTAEWVQSNLLNADKTDNLLDRNDIYTVLALRSKVIKSRYTELPKELPNRVKQLAYDITANYHNKYDKLKAIEAYLMKYQYTLNPGKAPKDRDFVDYFLFDNKKGYCTSYATAMAVLGRCIGVPTRYVEGFVVKCDNKEKDEQCSVKNSDAHAWAEAYLEGIGWIPFEATAPFYDIRYTKWSPLTDPNADQNTAMGMPSYLSDYEKMARQNQANQINHLNDDQNGIKAGNNYADLFLKGIAILLIAAGCLILSIFVYYYILRFRYHKSYHHANYSRKMYLLFLRILKLLQREGFSLGQQETILMLSKRVKNLYEYKGVTFIKVAEIFMLYRYGEQEITKEELDQVEVFYQSLSSKQKMEMSRFKAWIHEFQFLTQTDWIGKRQYNNA